MPQQYDGAAEQEVSPDRDPLHYYQRDLRKQACVPLSVKEEQVLFEQYWHGDKAAGQRLWETNLRAVYSIAKRYEGHGVSKADLIHEGNLALRGVVEAFNPEKAHNVYGNNKRLISYASRAIRKAMQAAINVDQGGGMFKGPTRKNILSFEKEYHAYQQEHGEPPTDEEIAQRLRRKEEIAHPLGKKKRKRAWKIETVRQVRQAWSSYYQRPASWDEVAVWLPSAAPAYSMDSGSRPKRNKDPYLSPSDPAMNPTHAAVDDEAEVAKQQFRTVFFQCLTPAQQEALSLKYMSGQRELTDEEVAKRRGTNEEAANRLKNRAIAQLRSSLQGTGMSPENLRGIIELLVE